MTNTNLPIGWLTEAELVLHRIRSVHRERVETIREDKSHVRLEDPTRLIVHVVPEAAFLASKEFSAADLKRASQAIRPLGERNGNGYGYSRFNADGFLMYDGYKAVREYTQLYRNGMFEGVMAEAVFQHQERAKILRENWCEAALISALTGFLPFAKTLALEPPFWMFAALAGCEGARICINRSWEQLSEQAIDRSLVWLPETKIESGENDPAKLLRPVCDVLWNAAGLEKSFYYDEQGNRKTGR